MALSALSSDFEFNPKFVKKYGINRLHVMSVKSPSFSDSTYHSNLDTEVSVTRRHDGGQ